MSAAAPGQHAKFVRAMQPVALELLGEPNRKLSSKRELRFGSRGSLSVDLDTGTWHNHEAGAGGGVLDLVRDRKQLDKAAAIEWLRDRGHLEALPASKGEAPRKIVATYTYHSQAGAVLFEVVRFAPKDFCQRRPDGNGGWIWNLRGIERAPYRLPELLASPATTTVLVAEGEKDVNALRALGFTATTNPGGVGKWTAAMSAHLRGRHVVILPDNDPQATTPEGELRFHPDGRPVLPGQDHATDVAGSLQGVAASVKVLMLPGLPEKGDPFDWIYAGGTGDELERLVREAPEWGVDTATEAESNEPAASSSILRLRIINPAELEFTPVPEREWIVADWLPVGHVTADYGDGGVGKTLLGQQLMTSCASGMSWCGLGVMRCRSLGLYCEDDEAELHRRQAKICAALSVRLAELGDMRWISGIGQDNALATFTADGKMHETRLFADFAEAAIKTGARLVVLDTAADLFAGNENDRHQVRQFLGLLNKLAMDIRGAVLLNAHPSRTGLSTGNLDGGSTAWNNSVRSRWSLARPQVDEGQPDTAERVLTRRKANYASIGDTIQLRWVNGVLAPVTPEGGIAGAVHRAAAETVFLELLDRAEAQGQRLSDSKQAGNFAPKRFAQRPDAHGYTAKEFERAMAALFASRQIAMVTYGRPGDARQQIARVRAEPAQ